MQPENNQKRNKVGEDSIDAPVTPDDVPGNQPQGACTRYQRLQRRERPLVDRLANAEDRIDRLESDLAAAVGRITRLENDLTETRALNVELEGNLNEVNARNAELDRQLSEKDKCQYCGKAIRKILPLFLFHYE